MRRHVADFDEGNLVLRDSSKGRFMSVQVLITASSSDQLQAIHMDLRATGRVHMVL
jgi:putative lipoic acid-binding regulatory protein